MRTLSANDFKMFEHIVTLKQPALMKTMSTFLQRKYNKVITTKEYICGRRYSGRFSSASRYGVY